MYTLHPKICPTISTFAHLLLAKGRIWRRVLLVEKKKKSYKRYPFFFIYYFLFPVLLWKEKVPLEPSPKIRISSLVWSSLGETLILTTRYLGFVCLWLMFHYISNKEYIILMYGLKVQSRHDLFFHSTFSKIYWASVNQVVGNMDSGQNLIPVLKELWK